MHLKTMRAVGWAGRGSASGLLLLMVLGALPRASGAATAPIQAVVSISMTVSDMDRSVAFYRTVLNFETVSDREVAGDDYEHLYGVFGARVRIVTLRLGDERLKLEEFIAPRGRPIPVDSRSNDAWFQHVAIIVRDMDRAFDRLRGQHVQFASTGPQVLPQWNPERGRHRRVLFSRSGRPQPRDTSLPAGQGRPEVAVGGRCPVSRHRSFRDRRCRHGCESALLPRHPRPQDCRRQRELRDRSRSG